MSLLTNSKFISCLWWLMAPILVAFLVSSAATFFLGNRSGDEVEIQHQKLEYLKRYPRFLSIKNYKVEKNSPKAVAQVEKFGNISLQACYVENNKKFIVFKEGRKTIFLDLGEKYKGAELVDVGMNFAVFLKNKKKIKLKLEEIKATTRSIKKTKQVSNQERYVGVQRDDLRKYTQNLGEALKDVRIQELKKNHKFAGIRISFIRRGSLFDRMKLRVGDVIKSIDGSELKSMMDLLPYYNRINDTATLQVGFERNNEMKEIVYEIN